MLDGILATIGNTPLVRLERLLPHAPFRVFAKLEAFNPGGSMKDRAAYSIIKSALDSGIIEPGWTIVESSSGNMGIGLAQVCAYFGLHFICVVDSHTTQQNIRILKAYRAEVDVVTEPDPVTGSLLQARINRVQNLLDTLPRSWWPNQYANMANALAHHQTMREIDQAFDGQIDYVFCATSTCGTVRGCADYIAARGLQTQLIAVDAVGSAIFGSIPRPRLLPGHGSARRPELYRPDMVAAVIHVTDQESVVGCHRLLRRESIMAGGSSGAVISALSKFQHEIAPGARCALILGDRGERYLDTIYSDAWIERHFGSIAHLWDEDLVESIPLQFECPPLKRAS